MYCKKCGIKIADDSVFCSVCGTKQDIIKIPTKEETDTPPTPPKSEKRHKWMCNECGCLIDHEPCIVCARGPQTPVRPIIYGNSHFRCPACGELQDHSDYCHQCGQKFEPLYTAPTQPQCFQLKYYYFQTRFLFWFSALLCLISGFRSLNNQNLHANTAVALLDLANCFLLVVVGYKMYNLTSDALKWYFPYKILIAILNFFASSYSISGDLNYKYNSTFRTYINISMLIGYAVVGAIIYAEYVYYKKRESLFVN